MPRYRQDQRRIYIVDDDDSVRKALSRLIRSVGLSHETFPSGEALLRSLPEGATGCLLMDIRMPGLTGHDVQEELRKRRFAISVIALSAQDDEETRERARQWGAVAFFRKPVDDQALLDAIKWVLDGQQDGKS